MRKQYNTEEISRILDRFMAGESSLAEEQLLADYFRTHEVGDEWQEYKEMFALFDSGAVDIEQATSADKTDSPFLNHHSSAIIRQSSFAIIGIAAAILIAFLLWPESHEAPIIQPEQPVIAEVTPPKTKPKEHVESEVPAAQPQTVSARKPEVVEPKPQHVIREPEPAAKPVHAEATSTDSFDFYLARLESEMDALDDSVSSAQLERLISADVRLRQLVNRIVNGEVQQALNALKPDSTTDYLNF